MSSVPEKLKIFIKPNSIKETREVNGQQEFIIVKKAFATDAAKKKTHETAMRWAMQRGWGGWDPVTKKRTPPPPVKEPLIVDKDNKPFTGLQIYDIDYRGEGGRAYKVRTKEGWAFDVREETLLDTLVAGGVDKGGHMKGEFIWCKDGSQMKITRVGSALHQRALADMAQAEVKRKTEPKLKFKDLEINGVYENKLGELGVYLGKKNGKHEFAKFWAWERNKENWLPTWRTSQDAAIETWEKNNKPGAGHMWSSISRWNRDPRHMKHKLVKSCSYIKKVGQMTPEDIKKYVRRAP